MLTIKYDPVNGEAIPDGLLAEKLNDLLVNNAEEYKTSSEIFIHYVRLRIKKGLRNIQFTYKDQILVHNHYGNIETWPTGFCEVYDKILEGLLGWGKK